MPAACAVPIPAGQAARVFVRAEPVGVVGAEAGARRGATEPWALNPMLLALLRNGNLRVSFGWPEGLQGVCALLPALFALVCLVLMVDFVFAWSNLAVGLE